MGVFQHWPNRITALRFLGAGALFTLFAIYGNEQPDNVHSIRPILCFAFWLFVVTAATDILDGYLARRGRMVTVFGRIADPFVDKILILGSMVFLAVMPWSRPWFPAWLVVVILAREFLVTGIRSYVESAGGAFPADWFGKIKMVVQCGAVGNVIWIFSYDWPPAWLSFWEQLAYVLVAITVITTVASGFSYILKTRRVLSETNR